VPCGFQLRRPVLFCAALAVLRFAVRCGAVRCSDVLCCTLHCGAVMCGSVLRLAVRCDARCGASLGWAMGRRVALYRAVRCIPVLPRALAALLNYMVLYCAVWLAPCKYDAVPRRAALLCAVRSHRPRCSAALPRAVLHGVVPCCARCFEAVLCCAVWHDAVSC
jgi:hypothetical protein